MMCVCIGWLPICRLKFLSRRLKLFSLPGSRGCGGTYSRAGPVMVQRSELESLSGAAKASPQQSKAIFVGMGIRHVRRSQASAVARVSESSVIANSFHHRNSDE